MLRCGICNSPARDDRFMRHFEGYHEINGWNVPIIALSDSDLSVAELLGVVERGTPLIGQGRPKSSLW